MLVTLVHCATVVTENEVPFLETLVRPLNNVVLDRSPVPSSLHMTSRFGCRNFQSKVCIAYRSQTVTCR